MIITIDGPAGTGKSSVSQEVARRLGFDFLDTGAMYRAIGLASIRSGVDLADAIGLARVTREARIEFDWNNRPPTVMLDGQSVAHLIRSAEVTHASSCVAVFPEVRAEMVRQQQEIGLGRPNLVTEGRDQGTVVFPNAELKIYLDATPEERANRRVLQLQSKGEAVDYTEILNNIILRDKRDSSRAVGPLAVAKNARVIDTTHLTQEQVTQLIVQYAQQLMAQHK